MSSFKVEIQTTGSDFEDGHSETVRILRRIAHEMEHGHVSGGIMDTNGNTCGQWEKVA